jgi:isopenicillin N synthase-like dioxygenase
MTTMSDLFTPIPFARSATDFDGFARALDRSFRETGFAVIEGHPVDPAIIARAEDAARAFFALPEPVKARYDDRANGGQRGHTAFGAENAKGAAQADLKEFWHTGRAAPEGSALAAIMRPTPSVSEIPGFDAATSALFDALDAFGAQLLQAVAHSLGLPRDWFAPRVAQGNSILRLLHYPAQLTPPPPGSVRAGAHEDINVITLLLGAEEAGLQALHRSGVWLDINPPPGSLVVNVGDMLARLTNHTLPSTTHRVLNPTPERSRFARYSMPFFLHFAPDVLIETLPQCVTPDHPSRHPTPITAQAYLEERLTEIGLLKRKPS